MSFAKAGETSTPLVKKLLDELEKGVIVRLFQNKEIYGGLQETYDSRNGLILPCETRTLSEITRAVARVKGKGKRLQILVNALVTLGRGNGWGSTNANASALLALSEIMQPPFPGASSHTVTVKAGGETHLVSTNSESPAGYLAFDETGPAVAQKDSGKGPVVIRAEISYMPKADGSKTPPRSKGFVISRELKLKQADDEPFHVIALDKPGIAAKFAVGDIIEEHVQLVNPKDRHYVAVTIPLAAGMEPMNPNLATAPAEARPKGVLTLEPTYAAYLDDSVAFYYNTLPKGTYDFYFRIRAVTPGDFIQPAASAEMMYDDSVIANSPGARVKIE